MFIEVNPAYLVALMFVLACSAYIAMSLISSPGNSGIRTKRLYGVTSVLLILYSACYGIMTITEHELLRRILWSAGFCSGLLFFPVWNYFLLHMMPPKHKIFMDLSAGSIVVALIIALFCISSNNVHLVMTRYGTQFSYYSNVYFMLALLFTIILAVPLIITQFQWWSEAERLRFRKIAKIFILIAPLSSVVGFFTDLVVPIFTQNTTIPLGPVSILLASLTTYFLMFSNKNQNINMRNVSGFTFSSVMMPILVLDNKNKVGLENKAAVDFFGRSLLEKSMLPFIFKEGSPVKQSLFSESFNNEVVTVESNDGVRTCEMILNVERDKLGDVIFKVAVINDRTESLYKDSLLGTVNQVSGILLEPDIGYFEINLYMAMGMMAKAVDVDRVYVWENSIVEGKLRCTQIYEWSEGAEPQQGMKRTINVSYEDDFPGLEEILSSGRCLNVRISDLSYEQQDILISQDVASLIVTPVFIQNIFWGFVGFDDCRKERVFNENEEMILRAAGRLIVNAMIRNDMTQKLDTALTDELTGARSRRYFIEAAEAALEACIENKRQFSVIIIDVDFFKKVNDTYGHPVGDEVLKILVSRIRNALKMDTLLARYGGEEFIVSLPDINPEDVVNMSERIRESIESSKFRVGNFDINVTISLGAASLNDGCRTLTEIIGNADKALYEAKQTGRNKVVYYTGQLNMF